MLGLRHGGIVEFGDLRRLRPFSTQFGFERGQPVDRYYIEEFLARRTSDIRGRVLEFGDDTYARRFGSADVLSRDVLDISGDNRSATLVGDLTDGSHLPSRCFDCVICTQTLHLIYDISAALRTIRRLLTPGGVLLATVPGISQIGTDRWAESWYWSLTPLAVSRLCLEAFPDALVETGAAGNVLSATALLYGLAAHELDRAELNIVDRSYPVVVTTRVVMPAHFTEPQCPTPVPAA